MCQGKNCNPTRSARPTPIHTKGWHVTNPTKTTHSNQSEQGVQLPVIVGFYTCQVYHVGILPIKSCLDPEKCVEGGAVELLGEASDREDDAVSHVPCLHH